MPLGAFGLLGGCSMTSFNPKGDIGAQEKRLILLALGLMPSKRFIEKPTSHTTRRRLKRS
ncbi:hypothetical protein OKW30_006734 [Paraburkholderia sp. Clong3]|nr:hypothetical protein [Paraburkholderia sp. HC6.4b]MBB5455791.1 hypothetical protein [Paraburkholderia sp. Kb1A]MBB5464148.1 hypothetical protein [Paraburkholderia sp. CI2]